jgi:PAS domain S-box-containing protein
MTEMAASESLLSLAFYELPVAAGVLSVEGTVLAWNAYASRTFGWSESELVGRPYPLVPPDQEAAYAEGMRKVAVGDLLEDFPCTRVTRSGERREILVSKRLLGHSQEAILSTYRTGIDWGKVEEAIWDREARFETIFNTAATGMAIVARDGSFRLANPSLLSMLGLDSDQILRTGLRGVTHPADADEEAVKFDSILSGSAPSFSLRKRLVGADGTTVWVIQTISKVLSASGKLKYFCCQFQEITDAIRREALIIRQVQQMKRALAELEQFGYATSHDLRQPVRVIIAWAETFRRYIDAEEIPTVEEVRESAEMIVATAQRMNRLIEDLFAFSTTRSIGGELSEQDLSGILAEAAASLPENTELETEDLGKAWCNPSRILRLFSNLLENSVKYSKPSVPLRIAVGKSPQRIVGYVSIHVDDNGIGILPQFREMVFDLFKRVRSRPGIPGWGLGLPLCRATVRTLGGEITCEDSPLGGTRFVFDLPLTATDVVDGFCRPEDHPMGG